MADPGEVNLDPELTLQKKPDPDATPSRKIVSPDPTLEKHPDTDTQL